MIPYGKHTLLEQDIDAVVDVLKNQFLTQGSQVPLFEQELCRYTGAQSAVAVNSGTSGLHIACLAAGVTPGDKVWTVPISFAASANCARYCGASVDFVDIDPHTRNLNVSALVDKLHLAAAEHTLPKVIVVVHFTGSSNDMAAIAAITEPFNITLIEDAAHALGASDPQGHKVGACKYSAMTVLSFHPVKSITSAEGGAVLTNDDELAALLRRYASHGITREPGMLGDEHADEPWFYAQFELGYNYRLSDLHAALGRSQLAHIDEFIARRRALAENYHQALADLPLILPQPDANGAWHLYMVELTAHDRTDVFNALRARGIGVNVHYIPIHFQPYYRNLGFKRGQFPVSERYYDAALSLPIYPNLTEASQEHISSILASALAVTY